MERTNKGGDGKVRWRKTVGGSLRLAGRIIKPNQIFLAHPDEIPDAFRDTIVPVGGEVPKQEDKKVEGDAHEYTLKARGGGWYDVVDSNGKVKNEKALKHAAALELIRSFEE